ncbi:MAG: ABC transporter ATP-binding protein [Acidimicrobiales bacterium]
MNMSKPVLQIHELTKKFGSHCAVSSLSLSIDEGEVVGLLGPNGSGKTTTLHMIVGLLEPTSGSISIDGLSPRAVATRRSLGLVPDDLPLPSALTGDEFLDLHEQLRGFADPVVRDSLVEMFALGRHLHRPVGEFSHGMKRKIQIVAAVSHRPRLLILDEPHRGLDPESAVIVRELVDILRLRGTALLVATHDLARAERDLDRLAILFEGQRLAFGTPADVMELAAVSDLESAFLRLTGLDASIVEARHRLTEMLGHPAGTPEPTTVIGEIQCDTPV